MLKAVPAKYSPDRRSAGTVVRRTREGAPRRVPLRRPPAVAESKAMDSDEVLELVEAGIGYS